MTRSERLAKREAVKNGKDPKRGGLLIIRMVVIAILPIGSLSCVNTIMYVTDTEEHGGSRIWTVMDS